MKTNEIIIKLLCSTLEYSLGHANLIKSIDATIIITAIKNSRTKSRRYYQLEISMLLAAMIKFSDFHKENEVLI